MSLPWVRKKLNLDDISQQKLWPKLMKDFVRQLATQGYPLETLSVQEISEAITDGLLKIAYNGARGSCGVPTTLKRDDIPGDPLPQTTSTVCIQAPLQHLEECRLTIVLVLSRCL
jgi:hypothetical protein